MESHSRAWLKDGSQEGACGKILETGDPRVVVKKMHRRLKHRSKCHNAEKQCELQAWAAGLLTPANGFEALFTPRAWTPEGKQYAMERIDCSQQVIPELLTGNEMVELKLFYEKAKEAGIFPCDYELYRQSDGRIGLIDFDKFAAWVKESGDEVLFPWGLIWRPLYPWS
jgi:hypothetical protein